MLQRVARSLWRAASNEAVHQRMFSSNSRAAAFDGEMVTLYMKLFEQHYHPNGPWRHMVRAASEAIPTPDGANVHILDIASGPGQPAVLLAEKFPASTVYTTDIAPDMVSQAESFAATKGLSNVVGKVVDAQDIPFDDASIDMVTACYGFMFCEDPAKAFLEVNRVLKPGGKLITTVWEELQMMTTIRNIMTEVLGQAPPAPPINPLSMREDGFVEGLLESAGFTLTETLRDTYPFNLSSDDELAFKLTTLPVKNPLDELVQSGKKPDAWEVARARFDRAIASGEFGDRDSETNDIVVGGNCFKMVVASKN